MRIPARNGRSIAVLLASLATAAPLAACGFDPSAIPVPGTAIGGPTYRVHIQFADALNLPARAEVVADGLRVGTLASARLVDPADGRPGWVVADADIADSARLPAATTAQLRQNTLLGDVYIALTTPPADTGPLLTDGATIPLLQTRPAVQVEDTMAGIATLVRGGAITRMQDIISQLDAVLPADPRETARMTETLTRDLTDVAGHLRTVDDFAAAAAADIDVIRGDASAIAQLFSADGARRVTDATASLAHLLGVFTAIGEFSHAIAWLAPLARSGDAAAAALLPLLVTDRPLDLGTPSNLNRLVTLLRDRILPFVQQGPKLDITAVRDTRIDAVVAALRMLGAVR